MIYVFCKHMSKAPVFLLLLGLITGPLFAKYKEVHDSGIPTGSYKSIHIPYDHGQSQVGMAARQNPVLCPKFTPKT